MISHLLNRELQLWRVQSESDGSGGQVDTWVHQDTRARRVSQPGASERLLAEQAGAALDAQIYGAADDGMRRGDELRDASTGEVWRVTGTVGPSVPGVYRRADCELIQAEGSQE